MHDFPLQIPPFLIFDFLFVGGISHYLQQLPNKKNDLILLIYYCRDSFNYYELIYMLNLAYFCISIIDLNICTSLLFAVISAISILKLFIIRNTKEEIELIICYLIFL